jgi:hypothetical protein
LEEFFVAFVLSLSWHHLIWFENSTNTNLISAGSVIDGQGEAGFSKMRGKQKPDQNALREAGNDTTPHCEPASPSRQAAR